MVWLINPETGRTIKKDGATYNRLKEEGKAVNSFKRSRTRYPKSPNKKRTKSPKKSNKKRTRSKSPRNPRRSPVVQRKGQDPLYEKPVDLSIKTGGRHRSPIFVHSHDLSLGPPSPRRTKRGKKIGPLPDKRKVMALPKAQERPLRQTLEDIPKGRKRVVARLRQEIREEGEGRGELTRGWHAAMPQRGRERDELWNKCGEACFLQPRTKGFPICPALREGQGCKVDCRGLIAAKNRAGEWGYTNVERFADEIYQKRCRQ